MRPSREQTYMEIAKIIAKRGTCQRGQVGCVITQDGRIVATGYNGPVRTLECTHISCDITKPCVHAIHAEANAIAFAARRGVVLDGGTLYTLTAPCEGCARLIIQSGIVQVYYEMPYRDREGIDLLQRVGFRIKVKQIGNEG